MKNFLGLALSISLVCPLTSERVFAQNTTVVTLPSAVSMGNPPAGGNTSTTNTNNGLQTVGNEAAQSNSSSGNKALVMGIVFGVAAYAYCSSQDYKNCLLYGGAAALAGTVVGNIMSQKKKNNKTADTVTVAGNGPADGNGNPTDPGNSDGGGPTGGNPDGEGTPLQRRYEDAMARLAPYGIRVSPNGVVTGPGGRTMNLGNLSTGALSRAGLSDQDIKNFQAAAANANKQADRVAATTDNNSDMFGDTVGGGGRASLTVAGLPSGVVPAGRPSGVDRNPAQVAGMSVNYGGEQIGVGADNIYLMIHRRYNLHEGQGGFLPPAPTGP